MSGNDPPTFDATDVAQELAAILEERGHEYALGGAIALGYWGQPRGTVDVDVTMYGERDPRISQWDELSAEVEQ